MRCGISVQFLAAPVTVSMFAAMPVHGQDARCRIIILLEEFNSTAEVTLDRGPWAKPSSCISAISASTCFAQAIPVWARPSWTKPCLGLAAVPSDLNVYFIQAGGFGMAMAQGRVDNSMDRSFPFPDLLRNL